MTVVFKYCVNEMESSIPNPSRPKHRILYPVIILCGVILLIAIGIYLSDELEFRPGWFDGEKAETISLSKSEKEACEKMGGTILMHATLVFDGPAEAEYCRPPDTGKACIRASDCLIDCLAQQSTTQSYSDEGYIIGQCGIRIIDNCGEAIIEEPIMTIDGLGFYCA